MPQPSPVFCHRLFLLLLLLALPSTGWAQTPLTDGDRLQVNVYTTSGQIHAAISRRAADGFVVVWQSYGQDGDGDGIFGRRLDASGVPTGSEVAVNDHTISDQAYPVLGPGEGGDFVVVWQSYSSPGDDSSGSSIQARAFSSSATPLANQFQVNTTTLGDSWDPAVTTGSDGGFEVAWSGLGLARGASYSSILGQRLDAAADLQGSELELNTQTSGNYANTRLSPDGQGGFWAVWDADDPGLPDPDGVYLRNLDSTGAPTGSEILVNDITTDLQYTPDVAVAADGSFLVTWTSDHTSPSRVWARRFDSGGSPNGLQFEVQDGAERGIEARIATEPTGGFLVVWQSAVASIDPVRARRIDSTGTPLGLDLEVSSGADLTRSPDVASDGNRGFVVVWEADYYGFPGGDTDGSGPGIFARRIALDDDGDLVPDDTDCDPTDPTNTTGACHVFSDGFETGDTGAWSP